MDPRAQSSIPRSLPYDPPLPRVESPPPEVRVPASKRRLPAFFPTIPGSRGSSPHLERTDPRGDPSFGAGEAPARFGNPRERTPSHRADALVHAGGTPGKGV